MSEKLEELIDEVKGSLRRAEHSYFVSLKYTRTVDVIRNLIKRYIETLSLCVDALIEYNRLKEDIEVPESLIERINLAQEKYSEDELITEYLEFLIFLRKVARADYGKCEEFRRHVTCIVMVDGNEHHIGIDKLGEYFEKIKASVHYTLNLVQEIKEDD